MWFGKTMVTEHSCGSVARHHGWRGALNFEAASQSLQNVAVDPKEEEVGMWVDPGEPHLGTAPHIKIVGSALVPLFRAPFNG